MHPNTAKRTKTWFRVQWGGLSAFIVKIPTRLRGTNFCSNCTSSDHFAPRFVQQWNDPKCTQTLGNAPKHGFRVQWGGSGVLVVKILTWLRGTNFCTNCTIVHQLSCSNETIPNAPKHYKTHQNKGLAFNGVDQVCWLRKIPSWLRGTNFCINCTSSLCFAPSLKQ
jgi:hypothetical protein